MDRHQPTNPAIWTGRIDSESDVSQFRMHQIVKNIDPHELNAARPTFSILGYVCDEGVRRNKGNTGAKGGPEAFRKAFANLAAHDIESIHDLGNITCEDQDLSTTQTQFSVLVTKALHENRKLVCIGGGHDIAYAHFKGIREALGKQARIGIINFDAHLDLRAVEAHPSSGTPFWQIAQEESHFHYCCIGIQRNANTRKLFETADKHRVLIIERNQMHLNAAHDQVQHFINSVEYLYLTIDLDGFDMSLCPGVSAPTVNGFCYRDLWPYLAGITGSKKLISMDIAELNPAFDQRQQTSKMAANIVFDVLRHWS